MSYFMENDAGNNSVSEYFDDYESMIADACSVVLEYVNDEGESYRWYYSEIARSIYPGRGAKDSEGVWSDDNESFIARYEDGWVVALNKYYMAFECECYDDLGLVTGDALGYILKSTNGDVPID